MRDLHRIFEWELKVKKKKNVSLPDFGLEK